MFYKNLLVYINANIDKINDKVMFNQINNYKYPQDEFIKEIKKRQTLLDNNDIEIYCILGDEADIQNFKLEIKKRTKQFFENYKINNVYKLPEIEMNNKTIEEKFYNLYIQKPIEEEVKFPLMLEMKKK